jgi:ABC-type multidrug transport system fused ATPase/permease subunit
VVCIGSDGQIAEHGTFADLKSRDGYVSRLNIAEQTSLIDVQVYPSSSGSNTPVKTKEKFNEEEVEVVEHTKPTGVYRFYSNAVGLFPSIIYLLLTVSYAFLVNFPYIWTKWWAEENEESPGSRQAYYMGIYAMLQTLCLASFGIAAWHGIITVVSLGGRSLHLSLLNTALNAPLSFFDKTDTGTTLNRFSQDMQLIDSELPQSLFQVLSLSFTLIGQFLLIMNASYWLAISFPAIGIFMWALQKVYLRTSRRLRHMELETKSPLYTQFLESIDGLATMRAYAWQPDFLRLYHQRLDDSQRPFYLLMCLQRWLALVLDMFSAGFVVLIVGLVVGLRDRISPGFAGVALSNMINLSQLMSVLVTTWTALETSVASVERIRTFQKDTPSEAAGDLEEPPADWPQKGKIEVSGLEATYRYAQSYIQSHHLTGV